MSEARFTAGPWEALFDKRRDNYSIFGGGSKGTRHWIANTKCESTPRDHAANAHLIAAAPELYEALQIARDYVAAELEDERQAYKGYEASSNIMTIEEDLSRADAALAKARGER